MSFNSVHFLIFFPIVLAVYYLIPKKFKSLWLLICSYYFYMSWNPAYVVLLLISTIVTYIAAVLIETFKFSNKSNSSSIQKIILALSLVINLGLLFFFKYFNLFSSSISFALGGIGINIVPPQLNVLLPVGISFYTFQALGYSIDVYRGDIHAEKNFWRYALFVSFFPQLVAGPIERSKNLLRQLNKYKRPSYESVRHGFVVMLGGFFLKMVIADRIAIFVDHIYGNSSSFSGAYLVLATVLFAVQIYCDFAGYSTIAIGAAEMLGIKLMDNFNTPYFSVSTADFWRRWHISLNSWFRDYLYIPLGGSKKGKVRKYLNVLIVFFVSGLWHGAEWSFAIWGILNALYQIIGDVTQPLKDKIPYLKEEKKGIDQIPRMIITFLLVDFAWIFFRADNVMHAFSIIKTIFTDFRPDVLFNGALFECGLNAREFRFMLLSVFILIISDIFKYNGIRTSDFIEKQSTWARWCVYIIGIATILIFGIWGTGYNPANFIYFQF